MAPAVKAADKAAILVTRQSASLVRLRDSVDNSTKIAEKMNKERPDADTARLLLSQRTAQKEIVGLLGTNKELELTISGLQYKLATAQDKIAVVIATADNKIKFWKWTTFLGWSAFALTVAGIIALFAFKTWLKTIPIIGPIVSRILP